MVDDILEPIVDGIVPDGYVEISEGSFTKIIQLDTPYELEFVDNLAESGWVLISIIPVDGKYVYWFQTKRKIYANLVHHNR
jgi:hypothetical protein